LLVDVASTVNLPQFNPYVPEETIAYQRVKYAFGVSLKDKK
jgi:hypothetical protein